MISQSPVSFTVVIPAYNPGPMLREALESVSAQTVPAAWVVVVDDGSTDGTFGAATGWLAEFGLPGEVLRQANQGISASRNAGLARRRTGTVALLDADDAWLPHHLANLARAYALCPEAIVAFGDSRFFGDSRSRTDLLAEKSALAASEAVLGDGVHRLSANVFGRLLPGLFFAPSAASFRMDAGPPEPRFATDLPVGEDRFLFLQLARRGPLVYVNEQSCRSRRHDANTTHSDREAWLREQALIVLEKIRSDPELALTPDESKIVDATQRSTAHALLYASSRRGIGAYRRACRAAAPHVSRAWSLRDFARAFAVTTGLVGSATTSRAG